jgi:hypothetical protein
MIEPSNANGGVCLLRDPQEKRAVELVATIDELFSIEARAREGRFDAQQRLALRQAEAGPWLEKIKTLALEARKAVRGSRSTDQKRRACIYGLRRILSTSAMPSGLL